MKIQSFLGLTDRRSAKYCWPWDAEGGQPATPVIDEEMEAMVEKGYAEYLADVRAARSDVNVEVRHERDPG